MEKPIKSYSLLEFQDLIKDLNQPLFRAKQLSEWIYQRNASSYEDMTNLPKSLRENLLEFHPLYQPSILDSQTSSDGTQKFILGYHDGVCVETVSIPSKDGRLTVCCSSQVGCGMACSFCATGKEGFNRNLSIGEIVDQIIIVQNETKRRVSNVVVMGQGEPFLNYDNTLEALRILNHPKLFNIGARHITLSTCGIVSGIEKLSYEPEQFTLAISLHTAVQQIRDIIMPGVSKYPLKRLKTALMSYVEVTNRRVSLEYALIQNINDQKSDLEALTEFCHGLLCHINLIPLNKVNDSPCQPSSLKTMNSWLSSLNNSGIETTVRNSRGTDIAGACGQLKNAFNNKIE
ncbi:MAG: 23S rRNA (adenine(2503)-C(2))-methyltransferase RlmN [Gordonibacter sp.]|nr:23S rRNA (adenine(2503)-C(2))-methyltransferase RlmN [Gordonibacter sp.]